MYNPRPYQQDAINSIMDINTLNGLLSYNPETGDFTWKERTSGTKSDNIFNSLFANSKAGSVVTSSRSKTSYIAIKIFGKSYKAHRLAFVLMGESLPLQVDHLDHNGMNNKWSNLRPSDSVDNSRNLPMQKSNKTGVIGVNWHKAAKKWQARAVNQSGQRVDLGRYDDFNKAVEARMLYEKKFGYYGYRGA